MSTDWRDSVWAEAILDEVDQLVHVAVEAERKRCSDIVRKLAGADLVHPDAMQMIIEAIESPETLKAA